MNFSESELSRYKRHLLLPEIGEQGQLRLKHSSVLVVGAGGLGSPVILYLAAAGFGKIGIVDYDRVDLSNLQRQIIYDSDDVGSSKVRIAVRRAEKLNPELQIVRHEVRITAANVLELLQNYDIVVDGSDNFATRYLLNDASVMLGKADVFGAIYRFEGQVSVFGMRGGPCYRCLFPDPPPADSIPNCAEGGVLGVMAGVIGSIQATEAVKIALGIGESLLGRLMIYDALRMKFDTIPLPKNPDCPLCGLSPRINRLEDLSLGCGLEREESDIGMVTPLELRKELLSGNELTLVDVRTAEELSTGIIAGAVHIPLAQLSERSRELKKEANIVVYCKSGMRSLKAIGILSELGFARLRNLSGGISAWQREFQSNSTTSPR